MQNARSRNPPHFQPHFQLQAPPELPAWVKSREPPPRFPFPLLEALVAETKEGGFCGEPNDRVTGPVVNEYDGQVPDEQRNKRAARFYHSLPPDQPRPEHSQWRAA